MRWRLLPWLLCAPWLLAWVPIFASLERQGRMPIDFLAYHRAAEAIERGESPYLDVAESRRIWRAFHQLETDLADAGERGHAAATPRAILARPQQPGPYLYPPTLALLIGQLGIGPTAFGALLLAAIVGFAWLWLRSAGAHPGWLALGVLSWDVLASLSGGNAELLLLFGALLEARLLWARRWLAAAPVIALVVLVKPFYGLFFVTFALLQLAAGPEPRWPTIRALGLTALVALALIGAEVARWGERLRAEAAGYLLHALEHQWFVLPVAEQTPMSAWNRAPPSR